MRASFAQTNIYALSLFYFHAHKHTHTHTHTHTHRSSGCAAVGSECEGRLGGEGGREGSVVDENEVPCTTTLLACDTTRSKTMFTRVISSSPLPLTGSPTLSSLSAAAANTPPPSTLLPDSKTTSTLNLRSAASRILQGLCSASATLTKSMGTGVVK